MLDNESIQVWRLELEDAGGPVPRYSATQIESWRRWLSVEEQRRAYSFHSEGHRLDYVVAHAALRWVLGRCLGIPAAEVRFREGSFDGNAIYGKSNGRIKPALEPGAGLDLRFNLSHTSGAALIGVAAGRELGIDIERERPMEDLEGVARSVMSAEEMEGWRRVQPEMRERAFYKLWTRKEAYLKAIGLGLYRSLQEVTVPVTAEGLDGAAEEAHWVKDGAADRARHRAGNGLWQIRDVPVPAGYSAAICVEGARTVAIDLRELDLPWTG